MRYNIFKGDRASNGARALQVALGATMLRSTDSRYTGRQDSCVINWGNTAAEAIRLQNIAEGAGRKFFNNAGAVSTAVNKRDFFRTMTDNAPDITIPWCDNYADAQSLVANGGRVFARTVVTGHSGKGIELMVSATDNDIQAVQQLRRTDLLPIHVVGSGVPSNEMFTCKLFTQGITGKRIEYRVHVFNGEVTLTQQKMRKEGWAENPKYNSIVRNVDSGWIYGVESVNPVGLPTAHAASIRALEVLGLDFGAVDIVYKEDTNKSYVLEVNTAPGLADEGSALQSYVNAFTQFFA